MDFKMFFSFDYEANGAWSKSDVIEVMTAYGANGAYYLVDGKPMVSTFEGPDNSGDWPGIRSSLADVTGGIYFVPDWTSIQGSFPVDLVDGACKFCTSLHLAISATKMLKPSYRQSLGTCGPMDPTTSLQTAIRPGKIK